MPGKNYNNIHSEYRNTKGTARKQLSASRSQRAVNVSRNRNIGLEAIEDKLVAVVTSSVRKRPASGTPRVSRSRSQRHRIIVTNAVLKDLTLKQILDKNIKGSKNGGGGLPTLSNMKQKNDSQLKIKQIRSSRSKEAKLKLKSKKRNQFQFEAMQDNLDRHIVDQALTANNILNIGHNLTQIRKAQIEKQRNPSGFVSRPPLKKTSFVLGKNEELPKNEVVTSVKGSKMALKNKLKKQKIESTLDCTDETERNKHQFKFNYNKRQKKSVNSLQQTLAFKTTGATSKSANTQIAQIVLGPTVQTAKRIRDYEKSLQEFDQFDDIELSRNQSNTNESQIMQKNSNKFLVQRLKSNQRKSSLSNSKILLQNNESNNYMKESQEYESEQGAHSNSSSSKSDNSEVDCYNDDHARREENAFHKRSSFMNAKNKQLQSGLKKQQFKNNLKNLEFCDECDEEEFQPEGQEQVPFQTNQTALQNQFFKNQSTHDFDILSNQDSLVSKAITRMDQTVNTRYFKIMNKRTKSVNNKQSKIRAQSHKMKITRGGAENTAIISVEDHNIQPIKSPRTSISQKNNNKSHFVDLLGLQTQIVYANRSLKERKFQNWIVDPLEQLNIFGKEQLKLKDNHKSQSSESIFESNFRTAKEEKQEMQRIYSDLFESRKSFGKHEMSNKQRRVDVHLRLTKSDAFKQFANYAMLFGSTCNLDLYDYSFNQFKQFCQSQNNKDEQNQFKEHHRHAANDELPNDGLQKVFRNSSRKRQDFKSESLDQCSKITKSLHNLFHNLSESKFRALKNVTDVQDAKSRPLQFKFKKKTIGKNNNGRQNNLSVDCQKQRQRDSSKKNINSNKLNDLGFQRAVIKSQQDPDDDNEATSSNNDIKNQEQDKSF